MAVKNASRRAPVRIARLWTVARLRRMVQLWFC